MLTRVPLRHGCRGRRLADHQAAVDRARWAPATGIAGLSPACAASLPRPVRSARRRSARSPTWWTASAAAPPAPRRRGEQRTASAHSRPRCQPPRRLARRARPPSGSYCPAPGCASSIDPAPSRRRRLPGVAGRGRRAIAAAVRARERRQHRALVFERRDQLVGVGVALRGVLRERAQHDRVERSCGSAGLSALGGRGSAETCLKRDRHRRLALERHHAGEQLVQDHADRVEVRGGAHRMPLRLLRGEVLGGAHDRARQRHVGGARRGRSRSR